MNAKKRALGRGLSALLDNSEVDIVTNTIITDKSDIARAIINIPLEEIDSNPFQPRLNFDETTLQELANSIKEQGVIQPITVRKLESEKFQLITGERRLKACKIAGLKDIPAYIREATDNEMREMALVENIQREDLNAIEIATSYQQLIDECGLTQEILGEKVGKNRTTITNYLRLLKLPKEIQDAVVENKISMGHARALINIPSTEDQISVLKKILDKDLSVRNIEEIVRNLGNEKTKKTVSSPAEDVSEKFILIKNKISQKLNSKILLKRNNKGEGSIVISFNSDDDLERIFSIFDK
jgi:ParB family transcriptional regulator, chromosome partitioning protein